MNIFSLIKTYVNNKLISYRLDYTWMQSFDINHLGNEYRKTKIKYGYKESFLWGIRISFGQVLL